MLGGGGCRACSVRPHFCWGDRRSSKGVLPRLLVPKGNEPTTCTLALWWLKFGPTKIQGWRWGSAHFFRRDSPYMHRSPLAR